MVEKAKEKKDVKIKTADDLNKVLFNYWLAKPVFNTFCMSNIYIISIS